MWDIGLYIQVLWKCVVKVILPLSILFMVILIPHANALLALFMYENEDLPEELRDQMWGYAKLFSLSEIGACQHCHTLSEYKNVLVLFTASFSSLV